MLRSLSLFVAAEAAIGHVSADRRSRKSPLSSPPRKHQNCSLDIGRQRLFEGLQGLHASFPTFALLLLTRPFSAHRSRSSQPRQRFSPDTKEAPKVVSFALAICKVEQHEGLCMRAPHRTSDYSDGQRADSSSRGVCRPLVQDRRPRRTLSPSLLRSPSSKTRCSRQAFETFLACQLSALTRQSAALPTLLF